MYVYLFGVCCESFVVRCVSFVVFWFVCCVLFVGACCCLLGCERRFRCSLFVDCRSLSVACCVLSICSRFCRSSFSVRCFIMLFDVSGSSFVVCCLFVVCLLCVWYSLKFVGRVLCSVYVV